MTEPTTDNTLPDLTDGPNPYADISGAELRILSARLTVCAALATWYSLSAQARQSVLDQYAGADITHQQIQDQVVLIVQSLGFEVSLEPDDVPEGDYEPEKDSSAELAHEPTNYGFYL